MTNHTTRLVPVWQSLIVLVAGVSVGIWAVLSNTDRSDMVGALIYQNFSVLLPQILLLAYLMHQLLIYRSIDRLISIRRQAAMIQQRLLQLVVIEISLYFGAYYAVFGISGIKPFGEGIPLVGGLILLLRYLLMLILGIILVWGYQKRQSGLLLALTVLISVGYHYWLEVKYLLPLYSPIYDPLYRAIHHIYRG